METIGGREQRRQAAETEAAAVEARAERAERLSMYTEPPSGEMCVEEFDRFTGDRLRVLKGIEDAMARGAKGAELHAAIEALLASHLSAEDRTRTARKDQLSHFMLRLAYCQTEERRSWLLRHECALFRARFAGAGARDYRGSWAAMQVTFMADCRLPYAPISREEFEAARPALEAVAAGAHPTAGAAARDPTAPLTASDYYRVPFELVPELVRSRAVHVSRGRAFVARDQLAALVVQDFRAKLSRALADTARQYAARIAASEADRLAPLLETLSSKYLGPDFAAGGPAGGGRVGLADLEGLMARHAPLCMKHLYGRLKEEAHLKHAGRMQLGLFLKALGLSLEDALLFWKAAFAKKTPADKFDKEYSYNVRHNYGREGKKTDYTAYACAKIIAGTPGAGEHHGCPYKTFDRDALRAALGRLRVSPAAADAIAAKAEARHYQIACGMTFEATHSGVGAAVTHPNGYLKDGRATEATPAEAEGGVGPAAPPPVTPEIAGRPGEGGGGVTPATEGVTPA